MVGYSGTPLPQKLGIKEGHRIALIGAPKEFEHTLGRLPAGVKVTAALRGAAPNDVILDFVTKRVSLERSFPLAAKHLASNGGLWVAWPKRASGVSTDVTEDVVRRVALANGLVDNKVCAIDDTWSGLRCVYRLSDRPKLAALDAKLSAAPKKKSKKKQKKKKPSTTKSPKARARGARKAAPGRRGR